MRFTTAGLTLALWLFSGVVSLAAEVKEREAPQPMDHTFVKLFNCVTSGAWEDTSDEYLSNVAKNFYWLHSHAGSWLEDSAPKSGSYEGFKVRADGKADWAYFAGPSAGRDKNGKTVGERLREMNPKMILTNYRNGAYTNQNAVHEAGEIERRIPLAIAVHDTHTSLTQPLGKREKVVYINPPAKIPENLAEFENSAYPFISSTTKEKYSKDKKEYVAWFRLDEEIMRINKAEMDDGRIKLTVQRGYWGTKAAPHAVDAVVLQPIYNGSRGTKGEYGLSGLPGGTSVQRGLRYVMNQSREEFWEFLGDKTEECLKEGYNGPWYDCTASTWINHSNAFGVSIKGQGAWDPDLRRNVDHETYREYQQRKIDYMFKRFPKAEMYVNWFFPQFYFENGTEKLMFSGANGHRPISGGAIEMYANAGNMQWLPLMRMQLDMTQNGYRHISWVKSGNMSRQYQLFAYGTHLMVHEPDAEQFWGGTVDLLKPLSFLFWDLGKPEQHFAKIEEAELEDVPGVYGRTFEKGKVLVNPDAKESKSVSLDGEYFEPEQEKWVKKVKLEPRSAVLLLK